MANEGIYICYRAKKFSQEHQLIIMQAEDILEEYRTQGFILTLRQLYYQFVARGFTANWVITQGKNKGKSGANCKESYQRLGTIISDARDAGAISWTAMEDRHRNLQGIHTFRKVSDALERMKGQYAIDLWHDQPMRPEVWVEKDALAGVIEGICATLRVDFFACKGYNSQSEQWRAAQRLAGYQRKGQTPIVFHLGDHDPSGVDMTRDNRDRLSIYAGMPITLVRLGLNMAQVHQYSPPPNYIKATDSRSAAYANEFGIEECWELDALSPRVISDLISENISKIRDEKLWNAALAEEAEDLQQINDIIEQTQGNV